CVPSCALDPVGFALQSASQWPCSESLAPGGLCRRSACALSSSRWPPDDSAMMSPVYRGRFERLQAFQTVWLAGERVAFGWLQIRGDKLCRRWCSPAQGPPATTPPANAAPYRSDTTRDRNSGWCRRDGATCPT